MMGTNLGGILPLLETCASASTLKLIMQVWKMKQALLEMDIMPKSNLNQTSFSQLFLSLWY